MENTLHHLSLNAEKVAKSSRAYLVDMLVTYVSRLIYFYVELKLWYWRSINNGKLVTCFAFPRYRLLKLGCRLRKFQVRVDQISNIFRLMINVTHAIIEWRKLFSWDRQYRKVSKSRYVYRYYIYIVHMHRLRQSLDIKRIEIPFRYLRFVDGELLWWDYSIAAFEKR